MIYDRVSIKQVGGKTLMNVVVANMYYFSLYYRENTGCLQCKA